MFDTLGLEELVPSALVSGEYCKIRATKIDPLSRPDLVGRAKASKAAGDEINLLLAKLRLSRALQHQLSKSVHNIDKHKSCMLQ